MVLSPIVGISVDIGLHNLRSYELYRGKTTKSSSFTFCNKSCFIEYLTNNMNENNKLTVKENE